MGTNQVGVPYRRGAELSFDAEGAEPSARRIAEEALRRDVNVVSLLPSATEMLYAVDVEPFAVSHDCDHPPEVHDKPEVTETAVSTDASTTRVNREVEEAVEDDAVYEVDVDLLDRLEPDVVVTQDVCDVCAVDRREVDRAVESIDHEPRVVNLHSHTFDGVLDDILTVGEAVDAAEEAQEVVETLRRRVDAVQRRVEENVERRPRTLLVEWLEPPMVAGHWTPEMVEIAGGSYGVVEPGASSEVVDWAAVLEYDPEVLLVAPCGFEVSRTTRELGLLTGRPGWEDVAAVEGDEVYVVDGDGLVNRPGPRLVDTLERYAEILHPEEFGAPQSTAVQQPIRIR